MQKAAFAMLSLTCAAAILLPSNATADQYGDFTFISDGAVITIAGYTGPGGVIEIPGIIDDIPVTAITTWAFANNASLTSVMIGNGVTNIDGSAFAHCTSLNAIDVAVNNPNYSSMDGVLFNKDQTILIQYPEGKLDAKYAIPASVTTIGASAFYGCTSLASVTIPGSVTSTGPGAFVGCTSLASIVVATANPNYSSLDGVLFNKARTILIQCPQGKLVTTYTIPPSVTTVGAFAFVGCTSLASITIHDSVTSIDIGAFFRCTGLTSVAIGNSVTNIGAYAFTYCKALHSVTLPASVTNIGTYAFTYCKALHSVTLPASVATIEDFAFGNCKALTNVTIPASVATIGDFAFQNCKALTNVTIPASVTNIGAYAFTFCTHLTSVYFSGLPPKAGDRVFYLTPATLYYLPAHADHWPKTYAGRPTAVWPQQAP